jgi:hypothetical protein
MIDVVTLSPHKITRSCAAPELLWTCPPEVCYEQISAGGDEARPASCDRDVLRASAAGCRSALSPSVFPLLVAADTSFSVTFRPAGAGSSKPAVAMSRPTKPSTLRKGALLNSCFPAGTRLPSTVSVASPGMRSIIETISTGVDASLVETAALSIIDQCLTETADQGAFSDAVRALVLSFQAKRVDDTAILDYSIATIPSLGDEQLMAAAVPSVDYAPSTSSTEWMSNWLISPATEKTLENFKTDIGLDQPLLVKKLDALRQNDPPAWQMLASGQFRRFLRETAVASVSMGDRRELVQQQAIFLYYTDIALKAQLIHNWTTKPVGSLAPMDCEWPLMARVLRSHIAEPAQQLSTIMSYLSRISIEQSHTTIFDKGNIPKWLFDSRLVEIAERIQSRLITGRNRSVSFARVADALFAQLSAVTSLNSEDLSKEGLGRREFVLERIGVTSSESSVILATALLNARVRIDLCIEAALQNQSVPGRFALRFAKTGNSDVATREAKSAASARALIRTSTFLRRQFAMDRHNKERSRGEEDTNVGRQMVKKTLKEFRRCHPDDAIAVLVHDPALWFA